MSENITVQTDTGEDLRTCHLYIVKSSN